MANCNWLHHHSLCSMKYSMNVIMLTFIPLPHTQVFYWSFSLEWHVLIVCTFSLFQGNLLTSHKNSSWLLKQNMIPVKEIRRNWSDAYFGSLPYCHCCKWRKKTTSQLKCYVTEKIILLHLQSLCTTPVSLRPQTLWIRNCVSLWWLRG